MAIFWRGGKWWIGYRGLDARWHREAISADKTFAKQVLSKRKAEVLERRFFPARATSDNPFCSIADKFWFLHGQHLKSKSWFCMFKKVKEALDPKKIGRITAADVQQFYNEIASRTSNSTANRYLTLLKLIFNKARAWGDFYGDNPCSTVKKRREPKGRLRYLSKDEMETLLRVAHPRLLPILICALTTGMRKGEILTLGWEHIDLDRNTIYVLETKSGKSRQIPLASRLLEVLLAIGPRDSGPVFELPNIMLRRYFAQALRKARIPMVGTDKVTFHTLRHTFASWFTMRTNDIPTLQVLLGHSTPAMTQRYAHLSTGHMRSEMALFEGAIPVSTQEPGPGLHQNSTTATSGFAPDQEKVL